SPTWLTPSGTLDTDKLLSAFLAFWRQHGQPLLGSVHYHEIAPHIVMMAFLHRVVNGGGTLEREYAIGTRRMDLCLRYGAVTLAIELKVWRTGEANPLAQGLAQLDSYLAGLGLDRGWLVIFDQREGVPPIAERTRVEEGITPMGRTVQVVLA
ncbi:MAG: ATP-binding protein, partial [Cyanobacteria bacterium J06632_3]